jgi:hypothetical protein
MFLVFEDRASDSPFVERVWRCRSERAGRFLSVASSHWEMVVTRLRGETSLTVRGPETKVTALDCPAEGEWLGIRFRLGTFMPRFPVRRLRDGNDVTLPDGGGAFWLSGSAWPYPDFQNAETFVARLVKDGMIVRDPVVAAILNGGGRRYAQRSAQRHFLRATGLTQSAFRQIERARHAANLLRDGVPILDTVHDAGFFDQAHLTHALKRLIGLTPRRVMLREEQLSFLYKTTPIEQAIVGDHREP